ncbi:MAG: hypothetical protein KDE54_11440 [Caldilineaceae bacterium]|nr:hypothetical protein [Caldilineaceae bacterium]MCB0140831.1 hypothetical protein [Caldilineaceae bacterium]
MKNIKFWKHCSRYYIVLVALLVLTACGRQAAIPPTEEEQIKNVATNYFVRDQSLPEYDVQIEEVVDDWARVSLAAAGVDTQEPMVMYLQNQAETDNPVATAMPVGMPSEDVQISNDFGWVVITQPQAQFTDAELDAIGVPADIRP